MYGAAARSLAAGGECPSGARGTVVVIRYLLPLNPGLGHVDSSRGAIAVVRFVRNRPQRKCAVGKRRARRGQVPQVVAGKRHRCMDRDRLWRLGTVEADVVLYGSHDEVVVR